MRKYVLLLPLFLWNLAGIAQESKNQFSIHTGVFKLRANGKLPTIQGTKSHYSYDLGLSYSRRLKKGFSLGMDFSTFQASVSLNNPPLPNNNPEREMLPEIHLHYSQNIYAFLPFIKWQTSDKRKLSFYLSTGLGVQYLAYPKAGSPSGFGYDVPSRWQADADVSFSMQKERSRIGNMAFAEVGIEYRINERHSIGLSAAFKGSFYQFFFLEPAFAIPVNTHLRVNDKSYTYQNQVLSGGWSFKLRYTYAF